MSLLNYFTKTSSNSAAVSDGTEGVFLAQTNEVRARPEDNESCATEVETSTPAASESGRNLKRKTASTPKRRRWNNDYVKYGFCRATEEEHSQYSSTNCLFCSVKYANSSLVSSKLELHLKKQHPQHQFKSKEFFESQLSAFNKQQKSFQLQMVNKELLLASFKMNHVVLKSKRLYTELESVVLPCFKVAADLIHGGKEAVKKVSKISLSDTTVSRRFQIIATDLEDQLIQKLKKAPSFAI